MNKDKLLKTKFNDSNIIVELYADDQKGGEGRVVVGRFNSKAAFTAAVETWTKAGGWSLGIKLIQLNKSYDPRSFYPNG